MIRVAGFEISKMIWEDSSFNRDLYFRTETAKMAHKIGKQFKSYTLRDVGPTIPNSKILLAEVEVEMGDDLPPIVHTPGGRFMVYPFISVALFTEALMWAEDNGATLQTVGQPRGYNPRHGDTFAIGFLDQNKSMQFKLKFIGV